MDARSNSIGTKRMSLTLRDTACNQTKPSKSSSAILSTSEWTSSEEKSGTSTLALLLMAGFCSW
jgi:hypothetical protein